MVNLKKYNKAFLQKYRKAHGKNINKYAQEMPTTTTEATLILNKNCYINNINSNLSSIRLY